MDRLAALFEQLPLPEIARLLRRTVWSGIGVGTVALVVSVLLNHGFVGLGACVGLGIGLVNIRMIIRSVAKLNDTPVASPKRVLASQTLVRLAGSTIIVVALAVASVQLGLGAALGVALFYLVLLANLVRALLRPSEGLVA